MILTVRVTTQVKVVRDSAMTNVPHLAVQGVSTGFVLIEHGFYGFYGFGSL